MDAYGLVPITVLGMALRISALHPIVKEDMSWILLQKLNEWTLRVRGCAHHGFVCPIDVFCAKWCANEEPRERTMNSMKSTVYLLGSSSKPWDSQGSWREWQHRRLGFLTAAEELIDYENGNSLLWLIQSLASISSLPQHFV
ncbi:hypothetical protein E2P81_ATG10928 [Venturia nashicola]|nr:hypothetical protein E2P81_ATG10928 [Venturia nashicola]